MTNRLRKRKKHNDPLKLSPHILTRFRKYQCFNDGLIDMTKQFNSENTWISKVNTMYNSNTFVQQNRYIC